MAIDRAVCGQHEHSCGKMHLQDNTALYQLNRGPATKANAFPFMNIVQAMMQYSASVVKRQHTW